MAMTPSNTKNRDVLILKVVEDTKSTGAVVGEVVVVATTAKVDELPTGDGLCPGTSTAAGDDPLLTELTEKGFDAPNVLDENVEAAPGAGNGAGAGDGDGDGDGDGVVACTAAAACCNAVFA